LHALLGPDLAGGLVHLEPAEALLLCVQLAAGMVDHATRQVHALELSEAAYGVGGVVIHPWVRIRHEAVELLAKTAKSAIDAGAQEHQARLVSRHGDVIAQVLSRVLDDLRLNEVQRLRAPRVVRDALLILETQQAASSGSYSAAERIAPF